VNIIILLSLVIIVHQDFKQRQISWYLLPIAFVAFVCKALLYSNNLTNDFIFNFLFIALQLVCLTLYFSIKNKKMFNIIDTYLGLGDILFFIVLCTAFSPVNFIVFYFMSMILTLTGTLIYNFFSARRTSDIPLAGAMAATLLVAFITTLMVPGINFYDDVFLLTIMQR
jgi:hypothetical protein